MRDCDDCVSGRTAESDVDAAGTTFAIHDAVTNATFGVGEVARVEGDRVVVRFDSVGYRTLSLPEVEPSVRLRRMGTVRAQRHAAVTPDDAPR